MFTGGRREETESFLQEKRIVVTDNPKSTVKNADITYSSSKICSNTIKSAFRAYVAQQRY